MAKGREKTLEIAKGHMMEGSHLREFKALLVGSENQRRDLKLEFHNHISLFKGVW